MLAVRTLALQERTKLPLYPVLAAPQLKVPLAPEKISVDGLTVTATPPSTVETVSEVPHGLGVQTLTSAVRAPVAHASLIVPL